MLTSCSTSISELARMWGNGVASYLDNNALNRSDISRRGWLVPRMVGYRRFYHPLHSQIHTFNCRSVNAGVIPLEDSRTFEILDTPLARIHCLRFGRAGSGSVSRSHLNAGDCSAGYCSNVLLTCYRTLATNHIRRIGRDFSCVAGRYGRDLHTSRSFAATTNSIWIRHWNTRTPN